jgi:hypothetical protein
MTHSARSNRGETLFVHSIGRARFSLKSARVLHNRTRGSPIWENVLTEKGMPTTDSSSFNLLTYNEDLEGQPDKIPHRLFVRPISFSEGTQMIEKTP